MVRRSASLIPSVDQDVLTLGPLTGPETMDSTEGRFLQWLRDAHAMEEQAEQMLRGMASRIKNYPELKAQLERHLDETRRQADMVRRCLERRGTGTSRVKDTAAKLV